MLLLLNYLKRLSKDYYSLPKLDAVYQLCFLFVKQEKQIWTKKQKRHLCDDCGVTPRTERKVKKVDLEHAEIMKLEQKRAPSSRIDGCYLSRRKQL